MGFSKVASPQFLGATWKFKSWVFLGTPRIAGYLCKFNSAKKIIQATDWGLNLQIFELWISKDGDSQNQILSEYQQLPINLRLFQNTVKIPDKFFQGSRNLKLTNRFSILSHTKYSCFGTLNLEKVKVGGFKCITVHSKKGNFWKKGAIILYLNVALSDTLVFLLNEYFIELNTVNFNFLNKFLNWILSKNC